MTKVRIYVTTYFGMNYYKRLPLGVCKAPDIARQIMEDVLRDMEDVEVYIDNICIFNNDWESHNRAVQALLTNSKDNGFLFSL
jgi:hypothetical protein